MSDRYRGRTTRQRNVAEKVARDWAARRAASELTEKELDLEKASVDAEVELLDPAARRAQEGADAPPSRPRRPAATRSADRAGSSSRGAGRRVPDLAVLPRLLHDTGAFSEPPRAAGRCPAAPGMHGKHVGLTSVPHGAKSYLAAALALARIPSGSAGSRGMPRSATGSRRSWARGSAIPRSSRSSSRGPRWPSPQRARPGRDGGPRRRPRGVACRQGEGARGQHPGAGPGDPRAGRPARRDPHAPRRAADRPRRAPRRAPRARLLAGHRGCRPRRVRAPWRHRRHLPAVRAAARPHRAVRRRDRLHARLRSHRPTQRRARSRGRPPARDGVPAAGRRGRGDPGAPRPDRVAPSRAPRAGSRPLRRRRGDRREGRRGSRPPCRGRRRGLGRLVAPHTGLDHLDASTLLVLDVPGTSPTRPTSCGARPTSGTRRWSRRATCRGLAVVISPPRDWKSRLHGSRTLELTWQSEAGVAEGMAFASKSLTSGDQFGWRQPVLPPDARSDSPTASSTGWGSGPGSCSRATRRRGSWSCWPRPGTPWASCIA